MGEIDESNAYAKISNEAASGLVEQLLSKSPFVPNIFDLISSLYSDPGAH